MSTREHQIIEAARAKLQKRLSAMPSPAPMREPDPGRSLAMGQLWLPTLEFKTAINTTEPADQMPEWFLLLTEELPDGLFQAVPIFPWTELADDGDLLLPAPFSGHPLAASLSMFCTVNREMLAKCKGRYGMAVIHYLRSAQAAEEDSAIRGIFQWGPPLLDGQDLRLAYHQWIAQGLETMQAALRHQIFVEQQTSSGKPVRLSIPFPVTHVPPQQGYALAADDAVCFPSRLLLRFQGKIQVLAIQGDGPFRLSPSTRRPPPVIWTFRSPEESEGYDFANRTVLLQERDSQTVLGQGAFNGTGTAFVLKHVESEAVTNEITDGTQVQFLVDLDS